MDPQATLELILDRSLPMSERADAFHVLEEWESRGGWMPSPSDFSVDERRALSEVVNYIEMHASVQRIA